MSLVVGNTAAKSVSACFTMIPITRLYVRLDVQYGTVGTEGRDGEDTTGSKSSRLGWTTPTTTAKSRVNITDAPTPNLQSLDLPPHSPMPSSTVHPTSLSLLPHSRLVRAQNLKYAMSEPGCHGTYQRLFRLPRTQSPLIQRHYSTTVVPKKSERHV